MSTSFSPLEFRDALSTFATGVTIVTTCDGDEPVGMTASSFNSVSMDPPLILWSVGKNALSSEVFRKSSHFSVHILSRDQSELSNKFARGGTDKFSGISYERDGNGIPCLGGVASRFDCSTWAVYEGGDHWILVGKVEALVRDELEALVFSAGSYAVASALPSKSDGVANGVVDGGEVDSLLFYNLSRAYHQLADRFHENVRNEDLSVPEWRILASLQGQASRSYRELAARTLTDPSVLGDILLKMESEGFCTLSGDKKSPTTTGTLAGHNRVEHLFALCREQDLAALGEQGSEGLKAVVRQLQLIVANTNT